MAEPITKPFTAAVAGISHYQDAVTGVQPGTPVRVLAEPDNPYDAKAQALYVHDQKIGYLASKVAERLGAGAWHGEVADVLPGPGVIGLRVKLSPHNQQSSSNSEEQPTAPDHPKRQHNTRQVAGDTQRTHKIAYARSGRLLGIVIHVDNNQAHIDVNNRVVAYPLELVTLEETA